MLMLWTFRVPLPTAQPAPRAQCLSYLKTDCFRCLRQSLQKDRGIGRVPSLSARDSVFGIASRYGMYSPRIESRWGTRFSTLVQTGPGAHLVSYTVCTGSVSGTERTGLGFDHPPPPRAEVKERVKLYLYSPSGPSRPVIEWILPLLLPTVSKIRSTAE